MAKKTYVQPETGHIPLMLLRSLTAIYIFLMMVVYPIYFEDKYYNMGDAKWHFFRAVTLVGVPILLAVFIWYCVELIIKKELNSKIKSFFSALSVTDWFVLAFLIASLLSFCFSPFKEEALWGFEGWYMGLIAQICFVMVYLFVSRFFRWDPPFIICYFAAAAFVFLMGVLMRFNIDPMLMYENLDDYYKTLFISTLGQTSWYSSYMILIVPLGIFAFWHYDNKVIRIVSGVFTALSYMTLVTQNSDSAYLGLVGVFMILFWVSMESTKKMLRFLECLILGVVSFKLMGICQLAFPERVIQLDTMSIVMSQSKLTYIVLAVLIVAYALLFYGYKKKNIDISKIKFIRYIVLVTFVIGVILGIIYIYLNTTGQISENLASDNNYLYFNDRWGNGRGSSWKFSVATFFLSEIPYKLFGAGPDCFPYLVYQFFGDELNEIWSGMTLSCAHNEWLNMLINEGLLGLISYFGIFVTAIGGCMKNAKKYPELIGVAMSTIAYVCHNIFCYQQIICTPIIFIIMGIGTAMINHGYEREQGLL